MTSPALPTQPPVLWAGSYTPEFPGNGVGLTPLGVDATGALAPVGAAHTTPSPSFAVAHPSLAVLYSADESRESVTAFAVDPADPTALTTLGSRPAGPAVCHVAVDPSGEFVTATCWGDGQVLLYPLDSEGRLGAPVSAPAATDPYADSRPSRDEHTGEAPRSQAHMTLVLDRAADGSRMLATTDLGYDLVRFWTWGAGAAADTASDIGTAIAAGPLRPAGEVVLPLGCGPRHLVRHPDGRLLVVTEYSVEVAVLEPATPTAAASAAPYRLAGMFPVLENGPADGDSGAEIALSDDARHVYIGVRGSDLIATLEVDGAALRPVHATPSGGRTPRHHLVLGDRLHVAHQDSDEVTTHALAADGLPSGIVARLPLGSPTVLARAPRV